MKIKKNKRLNRYKQSSEKQHKFLFHKWLKINIDRFKYKPKRVIIGERHGFDIFEFKGINNLILLRVNYGYLEAELLLCDEDEDIIALEYIEYIGEEKHDPIKGYYDADRVDGIFDYYSTQEELYVNNVFETAITKCNKWFIAQNSYYFADLDGVTVGLIAPTDEKNNKELNQGIGTNLYLKDNLVDTKDVKLLNNNNEYKISKYDLFDKSKEPLIRYFER